MLCFSDNHSLLLTSPDPSPPEDDIAALPFTLRPDYVSRRTSSVFEDLKWSLTEKSIHSETETLIMSRGELLDISNLKFPVMTLNTSFKNHIFNKRTKVLNTCVH